MSKNKKTEVIEMKKMFLIIAIFAMFFGTAMAQTGGDLSITCWNMYDVEQSANFKSMPIIESVRVGLIGTKTIVTNNTPAIEIDHTLSIACGSNFASFNPTQSVQSTSGTTGGTVQSIRENPVFFKFDQAGAGNCTATISYDGLMKSCNFPYNIGNVHPPLPTNNMFLFGVIGIAVVLAVGMYLLFGQKRA